MYRPAAPVLGAGPAGPAGSAFPLWAPPASSLSGSTIDLGPVATDRVVLAPPPPPPGADLALVIVGGAGLDLAEGAGSSDSAHSAAFTSVLGRSADEGRIARRLIGELADTDAEHQQILYQSVGSLSEAAARLAAVLLVGQGREQGREQGRQDPSAAAAAGLLVAIHGELDERAQRDILERNQGLVAAFRQALGVDHPNTMGAQRKLSWLRSLGARNRTLGPTRG